MKFVLVKKRTAVSLALLIVALALAIVATGMTGSFAVWQGKTTRKQPIYCVETQANKIALSFDSSWDAETAPRLLDTLEKNGVKATFFVTGSWAEKNAEQLMALSDSDFIEIGTFSNTHPDMAKLSAAKIRLELETSVSIIEGITGEKPNLFRAPFGSYSDTLLDTAQSLGLYTIQWDVDSLGQSSQKSKVTNASSESAAQIANRIVSASGKGSIILIRGDSAVKALPAIIEGIKNKGLEFVTIGELIYKDNYTIDYTGKQIRSR